MRLFFVPALAVLILFGACSGAKSSATPAPRPGSPAAADRRPTTDSRQPKSGATTTTLGMKPGNRTVSWIDSERLLPVLEEAQRVNKPVFLDFDADWCAPCKVMDEEVLALPEVYNFLNGNFLCLRVQYDSPTGKNIATLYEVKGLPTILFLDPKGNELARETGMSTPTRLRKLGEKALGKR
ncbi:MAG: thioredoxin family protein [Saprospiraceae bacterium]|nr:thioredoxin family protein [Saprospiraceae bacterium]